MTDQLTDDAVTNRSEAKWMAGPSAAAGFRGPNGPAWDRATEDTRANIVELSGWRGRLGGAPAALIGCLVAMDDPSGTTKYEVDLPDFFATSEAEEGNCILLDRAFGHRAVEDVPVNRIDVRGPHHSPALRLLTMLSAAFTN